MRRIDVHLTTALVNVQRVAHDLTEFHDAASFSTAGLTHRVRLDFTADGVNGHCDCLGNQNGPICQHIAAALEASTALSEPEPHPRPRSEAFELMARAGPLGDNFKRRLA